MGQTKRVERRPWGALIAQYTLLGTKLRVLAHGSRRALMVQEEPTAVDQWVWKSGHGTWRVVQAVQRTDSGTDAELGQLDWYEPSHPEHAKRHFKAGALVFGAIREMSPAQRGYLKHTGQQLTLGV